MPQIATGTLLSKTIFMNISSTTDTYPYEDPLTTHLVCAGTSAPYIALSIATVSIGLFISRGFPLPWEEMQQKQSLRPAQPLANSKSGGYLLERKTKGFRVKVRSRSGIVPGITSEYSPVTAAKPAPVKATKAIEFQVKG